MNDFLTIQKYAQELSDRWNKVTVSQQNKNSFTGIQALLKSMRSFLQNERKEYEDRYSTLVKQDVYTSSKIRKERQKIDEEWQAEKEEIISGAKQDVEEMIAGKFRKLDAMLTEAPTPQQYDLLRAIQMRGANISRGELMKVLPYFFTNYQGMKILETIARASGHNIMIPISGDVMDLYGELDRAGQYLLGAVNELAKPGKPDIRYGAFFYADPNQPGNADFTYERFIDLFDKPTQLQTYEISTALSASEQAKVNKIFRGLDGLDPSNAADNLNILRMTQQIMKDHPDDLNLMKRSQYGKYVSEVESIDAMNKAYAERLANDTEEANGD